MTFYFVFSNEPATQFMQNCNVFEKDKVVIFDPVEATTDDPLTEAKIAEMAEDSKRKPFRLIGCVGDGVRYADPSVKCVSLGGQWTTLENCLNVLESRLA